MGPTRSAAAVLLALATPVGAGEPAPERAPVPTEPPPGLPDLLRGLDRLGKGGEGPTDHAGALRDRGRSAAEGYRQPYVLVDLLARLGPEAREALPALETLARSPDPLLAHLAARAVRKIRPPQAGR